MIHHRKKLGFLIVALAVVTVVRVYRVLQGKTSLHAQAKQSRKKDYPSQVSSYLLPHAPAYSFLKGTLQEISFPVQAHESLSNQTYIRHGTFLQFSDARATIVLCHGFMCDKKDIGILRMLFRNSRYPCNILSFDFRGHGECSEEQYCSLGRQEIYDVLGAVDYLKQQSATKKLPIIGYGFSMGAVSLIEAQGRSGKSPFDALILDCPFDSSSTIIKRALERYRISLLGYSFGLPAQKFLHKYFFNTQAYLKHFLRSSPKFAAQAVDLNIEEVNPGKSAENITVPTLVITCINDEKVPLESVQEVYSRLASSYKQFWVTNGRRHFDSLFYNPEMYMYRVLRFIEKYLQGKLKRAEPYAKTFVDIPDNFTLSLVDEGQVCDE